MAKRSDLVTRFWSKVDVRAVDDCWEWRADLTRSGYGRFFIRHNKDAHAHRLSWQICRGPIPDGLFVCHKCDNRKCVNPDHLFLGTQADNMADMLAKGRKVVSCRKGESNPYAKLTRPDVDGIRKMYKAGEHTQPELAAMFGVSQSAISQLLRFVTWNQE